MSLSDKLRELAQVPAIQPELVTEARLLEAENRRLEAALEFKNRCYLEYLEASSRNLADAEAERDALADVVARAVAECRSQISEFSHQCDDAVEPVLAILAPGEPVPKRAGVA